MTFDDDYCQLTLTEGGPAIAKFNCKKNKLEWPPPPIMKWGDSMWRRNRYSQLTDEQRADMTHVIRGAEYLPDLTKTEGNA